MRLSHCNRCGFEVGKVYSQAEPKFCRSCGNTLLDERSDGLDTFDVPEDDEEFSLYEFSDLEKIIRGIVPEDYGKLLPEQIEKHIVEAIWKRVMHIDPFPDTDTSQMHAAYEREMQLAVERGAPPGFIEQAPRSEWDKALSHLVRQYHLVWVNGLVRRSHLSLTPAEANDFRKTVASSYYLVLPCDCDEVTYVPDETHPRFMRKA